MTCSSRAPHDFRAEESRTSREHLCVRPPDRLGESFDNDPHHPLFFWDSSRLVSAEGKELVQIFEPSRTFTIPRRKPWKFTRKISGRGRRKHGIAPLTVPQVRSGSTAGNRGRDLAVEAPVGAVSCTRISRLHIVTIGLRENYNVAPVFFCTHNFSID